MTWPAPMEMRKPGMTSLANRSRSRTVIPRIARERRGSAGKAAGSPRRRSLRWPVRDGRSSVSRRTLTAQHEQDGHDRGNPVGARPARRQADRARDPGRHDAAEDRRPDVRHLLDRKLHREQLVAVLRLGVLGQVGRDDDLERLVADRPQGRREDDDRQRLACEQGREREQRGADAGEERRPTPPPVRGGGGRERHDRRGRRADRGDQADRLGLPRPRAAR